MRNHKLHSKKSMVWGNVLMVLFLTVFTTMSFAAVAHAQQRPGFRLPLVAHSQQPPAGSAEMSWNPQSQALTVTLHVRGLQAGSNHAAHIHVGSCSAREKILYPFTNIIANTAGSAVSTTTFHHVTGGIPATGWNITVHKGATAQTGTLLCGNVVNSKGVTSVSVPLYTSP